MSLPFLAINILVLLYFFFLFLMLTVFFHQKFRKNRLKSIVLPLAVTFFAFTTLGYIFG